MVDGASLLLLPPPPQLLKEIIADIITIKLGIAKISQLLLIILFMLPPDIIKLATKKPMHPLWTHGFND